ncbi:hypothetical protein Calag_0276 [Caldisphaera lagunensis DSM 15908]|uniref:DUF790 family protein n=1 Tax=Caldisphaera lagunensis (strain DSM 15908 / JCM 11604 / ANMR 0165 / IC-154) TaxID=1056495 RepID=L0A893_CALLD|nr:DUF790 family protein [Caldisphaera lagunensis]AFZ70056.1 hypothetical protein Calag_0276 [Caldisphaera lagunensis DSM 15908]
MFSTDLLRVKYRKDKVYLNYLSEENYDLVEEIMSVIKENILVGEFNEEIKYLKKAYDPKLVEGIATLLLRKSVIESKSPIDPKIIRSRIFSYGPIIDEKEKMKVLDKIKQDLGVDPMKYIFSDLEEEMVIKSVPKIDLEDLIREYNFELLQTALMKTLKVNVYISNKWKELLFNAKKLGLMYNAYSDPFNVEIYGPASLLRLTERYGRSISMLLPIIISNKNWRIKGEFVGKYNRVYLLEANSNDALFPLNQQQNISFDSSIEKDFYSKMKVVASDWEIIREPEPLIASNSVFIPDFLLVKNNVKIYVEIVGFWTKEYLRRKSEKVKEIKLPLILIVDESLGYEDFKNENVIKFKKSINIASVYYLINKIYDNLIKTNSIKYDYNIELKEDIVTFDEISKKFNIPKEKIREEGFNIKGYTKLKKIFIKNDFLQNLKDKDFNNLKLSQLINQYGDWILDVLDFFGYQIKWINITDAIVKKV